MNTILQMLEAGGVKHDLDAWWRLIESWPSMDEFRRRSSFQGPEPGYQR